MAKVSAIESDELAALHVERSGREGHAGGQDELRSGGRRDGGAAS